MNITNRGRELLIPHVPAEFQRLFICHWGVNVDGTVPEEDAPCQEGDEAIADWEQDWVDLGGEG